MYSVDTLGKGTMDVQARMNGTVQDLIMLLRTVHSLKCLFLEFPSCNIFRMQETEIAEKESG